MMYEGGWVLVGWVLRRQSEWSVDYHATMKCLTSETVGIGLEGLRRV